MRPRPASVVALGTALALWGFGALMGCGVPRTTVDRVAYSRNHAQQHYGDCASPSGCTRIELRWPEITSAPTDAARESLITFLHDALLRPYEGGAPLSGTDSVMSQFIEAYRASATEFPESGDI